MMIIVIHAHGSTNGGRTGLAGVGFKKNQAKRKLTKLKTSTVKNLGGGERDFSDLEGGAS